MIHSKYVIVGGGMTADAAAKSIKKLDPEPRITLISDEADPPYDRPPLTKDLWKDKTVEDIWRATESIGVDVVRKRSAVALDAGKKEIIDSEGEVYRFEKALLATGGSPRRPPLGSDQILYYRTLQDYRRLQALVQRGDRFAVLGGGFIGAEITAALCGQDKDVTIVFPECGINGRLFPQELAEHLNGMYRDKGVTVEKGQSASRVTFENDVFAVTLESGKTFEADGVVAGFGITPNSQLAAGAGLKTDNGIIVDDLLRTQHPDVFAAGDVAAFQSNVLGRRLRFEHEDNANHMGETAGLNMAGESRPYERLPFFYSDLFDAGYEAVGNITSEMNVVPLWEVPLEKGILVYLDTEKRARGVVFWNVWDQVDAGRELIAAAGPFDAERLKIWAGERLSL